MWSSVLAQYIYFARQLVRKLQLTARAPDDTIPPLFRAGFNDVRGFIEFTIKAIICSQFVDFEPLGIQTEITDCGGCFRMSSFGGFVRQYQVVLDP
jgi:Cu/Ag efflux pump CusA